MNKALTVRIITTGFVVAYPFLVYFGLQTLPPSLFGIILLVILAMRFSVFETADRVVLLPLLLIFIVYAITTIVLDNANLLLYYPALVNFALFAIFANSLRNGEPLLLRMVRSRGIAISKHTPFYLYRLTALWAVFFVINGLVSLWTSTLSLQFWALYNGLYSYLIIAILGGGEWLFRRRYKKRKALLDP
jgi:uncharacterized membrane protein